MTGRPRIEDNPVYMTLVSDIAEVRDRKTEARERYLRELAELDAKHKESVLAACRRAVDNGLSAHGVGKAMKITNAERRRKFMAEVMGENVAPNYKSVKYFDAEWSVVKGWKMRRQQEGGKIGIEGKPSRVVEVESPDGEKWEASVCQWGFNHAWNYWIEPGGRKVPSNTYHTEHIPWQVRVVAFGEKWLDEVEEVER